MDFYLARNTYKPTELLTMEQVAKVTGYKYWYIRALRSGHEKTQVPFPPPDTTIGRRPLWAKKTISKWMQERRQNDVGE